MGTLQTDGPAVRATHSRPADGPRPRVRCAAARRLRGSRADDGDGPAHGRLQRLLSLELARRARGRRSLRRHRRVRHLRPRANAEPEPASRGPAPRPPGAPRPEHSLVDLGGGERSLRVSGAADYLQRSAHTTDAHVGDVDAVRAALRGTDRYPAFRRPDLMAPLGTRDVGLGSSPACPVEQSRARPRPRDEHQAISRPAAGDFCGEKTLVSSRDRTDDWRSAALRSALWRWAGPCSFRGSTPFDRSPGRPTSSTRRYSASSNGSSATTRRRSGNWRRSPAPLGSSGRCGFLPPPASSPSRPGFCIVETLRTRPGRSMRRRSRSIVCSR